MIYSSLILTWISWCFSLSTGGGQTTFPILIVLARPDLSRIVKVPLSLSISTGGGGGGGGGGGSDGCECKLWAGSNETLGPLAGVGVGKGGDDGTSIVVLLVMLIVLVVLAVKRMKYK